MQLDCNRENLPLEIPLIWEKPGTSNDVIAIGSKIISHEYRQRAKLINQYNTLAIDHSDLIDSGKYICSAAIPDEPPIIEYNVEVKIKHNLVWHTESNNNHNYRTPILSENCLNYLM